ncbi:MULTISPECIES: preprotein translocase subunit YajC [Brevibacillus]|uniref:Preprotein translocase subunit YajC n=1 Tax=Brevibacillus brevis (strain 47 / JCM 6285 / NBRC 100599) TaxID=358681 RepID=C0ZAP0_BREBN|nr:MULTISPECIES: preprotein translocase subunit YajC [Bacillales]NRR01881.1 preprotein translocase subunit YajC [Brevibacillus sp. RS1.1]NRS48348.1 preprotein translocase subunit YajC [Brevibacillus sp. HB2.2]TQR39242.1 preprotein translocase subunit YajC [Lysinibacillus sp. SDF0063]UIO44284.1 preprotein translocase subunit YajC [Brevibacillus brevis]WGV61951.1 preprotein translocase subunit YajC [Brevibacillus brevis]
MDGLTQFLPIIIMFAIFYFLLIRPQQKKAKQRNAMLGALKKGDKIVTIGGVHGTIQELSDDTVTLRIAHNVNVTFDRGAINNVASSSNEPAKTELTKSEETKEESK